MTVTMVPYIDLSTLQTECRNDKTSEIDVASTADMCCTSSSRRGAHLGVLLADPRPQT